MALRTLTLAIAAFRALAVRCSGVMVSKDRLPPIFPPRAPIARMTAETVCLFMLTACHETAYYASKIRLDS